MERKKQLFINLILLMTFFSLYLALALINNTLVEGFHIPVAGIFVACIITMVSSLWIMREMLRLAAREKDAEMIALKLAEATNLITTLRGKSHDFANHLQVILGMIQMKREGEAADYIKGLARDLIQIDKLVALRRPEVAALISTKLAGAGSLQVSMEIKTNLADLEAPSPEKLVSILGNLIDNAIYEATRYDDRWLHFKLYQEESWCIFEITNPGCIPPEIRERIYDPGFTTKGDKGSGMGLFIVRNLVEDAGGQLCCTNAEDHTTFKVMLPLGWPSRARKTAAGPSNRWPGFPSRC